MATEMQILREQAELLGYKIEKYRGEDKFLIRDLYSDIRYRKGLTLEGVKRFLQKGES